MSKKYQSCMFLFVLTTVAVLFVSSVSAELVFTPSELNLTVAPGATAEFPLHIKNTGSEPVTIYGIKSHIEPFPSQWSSQMCVGEKCYAPHMTKTKGEKLESGEEVDFHISVTTGQELAIARIMFSIQDSLTQTILWVDTFTCSNGPSSIHYNSHTQKSTFTNLTIKSSGSNIYISFPALQNDDLKSLKLITVDGKIISTIPFSVNNSQFFDANLSTKELGKISGNGIFCLLASTRTNKTYTATFVYRQ